MLEVDNSRSHCPKIMGSEKRVGVTRDDSLRISAALQNCNHLFAGLTGIFIQKLSYVYEIALSGNASIR